MSKTAGDAHAIYQQSLITACSTVAYPGAIAWLVFIFFFIFAAWRLQ